MRKEVQALIKEAYPTGHYEEREDRLLEKYLEPGTIQKISSEMNALSDIEVVLRLIEDYSLSYDLTLCTPDATMYHQSLALGRHNIRKILKKNGKTLSYMYLRISGLGPFYQYYWNFYGNRGGNLELLYSETPPTPFWAHAENQVQAILSCYRLTFLTNKESLEPVAWVSPGNSLVNDGIVTVYNCLFSEV